MKNIDEAHSRVDFTDTSGTIRFKTRDSNFLEQHSTSTNDTLFEWNVTFFGEVNANDCAYKINKSTMEITLCKKKRGGGDEKWTSAIKRNHEEIEKEATATEKIAPSTQPAKKQTTTNTTASEATNVIIPPMPSPQSVTPPGAPIMPMTKRETCNNVINKPQTTSVPVPRPNLNRGMTGLNNLGNTCYMNAALQLLINATDLRNYFIGIFLNEYLSFCFDQIYN